MMSIVHIKHILTAAFLVAVFSAPLLAKNITAQEYFSQLVSFVPPSGFVSQSGGANGGLEYVFEQNRSDVYGKITLIVQLMMPEGTLQDILDHKIEEYSKRENISVRKAWKGDLDGRAAAIVEYSVALKSHTLHIKKYYVPLESQNKGQTVFAPVAWSSDKDRLEKLDRSLQEIKFIDKVDLSGI